MGIFVSIGSFAIARANYVPSAGEDAVCAYSSAAGGGGTRRKKVVPGDKLLKLPTKQVCQFALETPISTYRSRVAVDPG